MPKTVIPMVKMMPKRNPVRKSNMVVVVQWRRGKGRGKNEKKAKEI